MDNIKVSDIAYVEIVAIKADDLPEALNEVENLTGELQNVEVSVTIVITADDLTKAEGLRLLKEFKDVGLSSVAHDVD